MIEAITADIGVGTDWTGKVR